MAGVGEAAVIGGESRQTLSAYAKRNNTTVDALLRRFGASGGLECPGVLASAQLVHSRRIVITNAHNLLNADGRFPWSLDVCVFVLRGRGGKLFEYRVNPRLWKLGSRRPSRNRYDDWAVLTLEASPPAWVRPYRIVDPRIAPVPRVGPITVIAATHDNWRGMPRRTASIERCRLRPIGRRFNGQGRMLGFDCDTGKGASGGALLFGARGLPRLIGIGVGQVSQRRGGAYHPSRHFNAAVPLHRRIYDAIREIDARLRPSSRLADQLEALPQQ